MLFNEVTRLDRESGRLRYRALLRDNRAVTALEYGILAALVAMVIIGSVTRLGVTISAQFSDVSSSVTVATK
jgi:pilus assembly protein Flp/PilA